MNRRRTALALVLGVVVGLVASFPAVGATILGPYRIYANSMAPNVTDGDVVYCDPTFARQPFGAATPNPDGTYDPVRGDMVMFQPDILDSPYIKRVVGLPGETIQLKDGQVFIDGSPAALSPAPVLSRIAADEDAEQLTETLPSGVSYDILDIDENMVGDDTKPFEIPSGHYFVLGDNRDNSLDSRFEEVGFVAREAIIGRAWKMF